LDGSAWSRQIVAPIRRLLSPSDYDLILMRAAPLPTGMVGPPPKPVALGWMGTMHESQREVDFTIHPIYDSQQEQNERDALEQSLLPDQRLLQGDGYAVTSQVRFGEPAAEIAELARHVGADIVAMATHGQTGLRHLLLGSVAEQVLRELTIPLLLVRPSDVAESDPPARVARRQLNVVVPLDGSRIAEQALDRAASLPAIAGARLVLVAVEPMVVDIGVAEIGVVPYWMLANHEAAVARLNEYLKQIAARLARAGLEVETRLAEGNPAEEILRISGSEQADLIVMATHSRGGVKRLLLGSVADKVLRGAHVPVLLMRGQPLRN
jgi:nucleotide-binding universal stress UspA family protein